MNRLASVRFDRVLADAERAETARVIASADATVSSWSDRPAAGRTYASLRLGTQADVQTLAERLQARVDEPTLVVLSIVTDERRQLDELAAALGGRGRPAGIADCRLDGDALLLELNDAITPLSFLVDVVDVVLGPASGRRIVPLLGLRDETLAALAGATLAEPALDASRTIEIWLDTLRRTGAAR
ncbi:MAG: hypothetical protein ACLPYS_05900 [Vulcanimicrobiaceae bacterium]